MYNNAKNKDNKEKNNKTIESHIGLTFDEVQGIKSETSTSDFFLVLINRCGRK